MTDHPPLEPRLRQVACLGSRGLHRMAYWEWGDAANPDVVVCVHGLTRQGRDFDVLARQLASDPQRPRRVVCPDVVGRGHSDRLPDPMAYGVPTYVADMVSLLARLDVPQVDWVGTSMGGLIGLGLASLPVPAGALPPVRRLVLNDVGPTIEPAALRRIGSYVGQPARWPTVQAAADALRVLAAGFGPHSDQEWLALSRPQLRPVQDEQGAGYGLHYDPAIAVPFRAVTPELAAAGEGLLWQAYDRLPCATLLLRGAESDLLSPATAQAMTQRGPRAQRVDFPGVGHAPTLVAADQRAVVSAFLQAA
jgi:pimeloyl-ACP methyl ester carboxylesterase